MELCIIGSNLPGRSFCRPDGTPMNDVHVAIQIGRDHPDPIPADNIEARWIVEIDVVNRDDAVDFRGPAVNGKRGDRFVYLTWGDLTDDGFERFRRAKLMLNRIDDTVVHEAAASGHLLARVDLTADDGGPRCARVDPPAIEWSAGDTTATA